MEINKLDQLVGEVGMEGDGDSETGPATRTGRHGGRWRLRSWTSYLRKGRHGGRRRLIKLDQLLGQVDMEGDGD